MFLWMIAIAAQAAVSQPLPPVGKWNVEYADQSCVLSRTFGSGKDQVGFAVTPDPTDTSEISIVTFNPLNAVSWKDMITVEAGSGSQSYNIPVNSYNPKGSAFRIIRFRLPNTSLPVLLKADSITRFTIRRKLDAAFAMDKTASAMAALNLCNANLLKQWHVDGTEVVFARTFRRASPLLPSATPQSLPTKLASTDVDAAAAWFTADDYPSKALRSGLIGEVKVLWRIGSDKKLSDCKIIKSSGVKSLDETTCAKITARGIYAPILNESGKPKPGWDWMQVNWQIPQ